MDARFMKRVRATQRSDLAGRGLVTPQSLAFSIPSASTGRIPTSNTLNSSQSNTSSHQNNLNSSNNVHHIATRSTASRSTTASTAITPSSPSSSSTPVTNSEGGASRGGRGGAIRRRDTTTRARTTGPPGSSRSSTPPSTSDNNSNNSSNNHNNNSISATLATSGIGRQLPMRKTRLFGNTPGAGTSAAASKGKQKAEPTALESKSFSVDTLSSIPATAPMTAAMSTPALTSTTSTYSLRGSARRNMADSWNTGGSGSSGSSGGGIQDGRAGNNNTLNATLMSTTHENTPSLSIGIGIGSGSGSGVNDSENIPLLPSSSALSTTAAPSTPQAKRTSLLPLSSFDLPSSSMDILMGSSSSSTTMRSPGLKSPTKKRVYDRFIPVRESDLSEQYSLLPDAPSTPSRQRLQNLSMTSSQVSQMADNYKKAQDQSHGAIMANELNLMPHMQSPNENNHHNQRKTMLTSPQRFLTSPQRRLFNYSSTTTYNTMHFDSPARQIYASTPVSFESRRILLSPKKATRTVGNSPFKVLDAPDLKDDFYLNLVDWSSQNVLGVGLGSCVYMWHALNGKVTQLCDLGSNDSVASLSWISMGTHLAVGTDSGAVQIWDVQTSCRVRTMAGHQQRVGVLAWSGHTLTSGSRDRTIFHRDVRTQAHWSHKLEAHTGEVCGLKWNPSGTQLASGGNDNRLMVWERGMTKPLHKFRDHTAAVKAIDWNPHTSGVLASGGGTVDRHIRFWNTNTGQSIGAYDTGSQVCNLVWSKTTNELVSTHGYSQNQVFVWKYPTMEQIAVLKGHSYRVLYLSLSPDGQTIVTGAGDETLRFWNVFQKSKVERRDDDDLESITGVNTIR